MNDEWQEFVSNLNNAIKEANDSDIKREEVAASLVMVAKREFRNSDFLQNEYESFALFAQEVEFESEEFVEYHSDSALEE